MTSFLAASILGALALQHIAYILQYGSIFQCHRDWLKRRAGESWACGKLSELVHCQLCTITQLSFWCWALPLSVWWPTPVHAALGGPVGFLAVWFGQAALGQAAWDVCRLIGRGSDALVLRARKGVK